MAIVVTAQSGKAALAQEVSAFDRPGAVVTINQDVETSETSGSGLTASSSDRYRFVERVIASRRDGLELEYAVPKGDPDAPNYWQFPVRVLRPIHGTPRLLNQPELEARLAKWLAKGRMSRTACGQSVFTWNVFRIECDPQSALGIIAKIELRGSEIREGSSYTDPEASSSIILKRVASPGARTVNYSGQASIDAAKVRAAAAQSDVVTAQILRKPPLSFDDAAKAHATDEVSGTVAVTLEVDQSGEIVRRTRVITIETRPSNGPKASRTITDTTERRRVGE